MYPSLFFSLLSPLYPAVPRHSPNQLSPSLEDWRGALEVVGQVDVLGGARVAERAAGRRGGRGGSVSLSLVVVGNAAAAAAAAAARGSESLMLLLLVLLVLHLSSSFDLRSEISSVGEKGIRRVVVMVLVVVKKKKRGRRRKEAGRPFFERPLNFQQSRFFFFFLFWCFATPLARSLLTRKALVKTTKLKAKCSAPSPRAPARRASGQSSARACSLLRADAAREEQ